MRDEQITLEKLCEIRRRANQRPRYFFFGYRDPVSWYLSVAGHFNLNLDDDLRVNFAGRFENDYPWREYTFEDTLGIVERASRMRLLQKPFNWSEGFSVLRRGRDTVILYRFDRMNQLSNYIVSNIDSRFWNLPERVNKSPDYMEYKGNFRLPVDTLRKVYDHPTVSFFFSPEERRELVERYADRLSP